MTYSFRALPPSGFQSTQGTGRGSQVPTPWCPLGRCATPEPVQQPLVGKILHHWAGVCPPSPPGLSLVGYSQQSRHFLFYAIRYLRTWESAGMANLETFNWDAANLILSLADLKGKKKIFKKKNQTSIHFLKPTESVSFCCSARSQRCNKSSHYIYFTSTEPFNTTQL